MQVCDQRDDGLEHTASNQNRKSRGKNAGYSLDYGTYAVSFCLFF